MVIMNLNSEWKFALNGVVGSHELSNLEHSLQLPYDFLIRVPRDQNVALGEYNGYYPACMVSIVKTLQLSPECNGRKLVLELSGVCGIADVYINGILVGSISEYAPSLLDVTNFVHYADDNELKIVLSSSPLAGRYTGMGIAGYVKLFAMPSDLTLLPYGLQVVTTDVSDVAQLKVFATTINYAQERGDFKLEILLFNAKGRRVCRRLRRIKLKGGTEKTFFVNVKLRRFYEYNESDPYLYSAKVNIIKEQVDNGEITDVCIMSDEVQFGIRNVKTSPRGLLLNGKSVKLMGAELAHDNGIMGNASHIDAELYKLKRIKELGYNAVKYTVCPTDAALEACDKLGVMAVVDLFAVWLQGNFALDGHADFEHKWHEVVKNSILKLRNHPSVILYGIGTDLPESYNRGEGAEWAAAIASRIRDFDDTRPVLASAGERELLPFEKKVADPFAHYTKSFFGAADINGYVNLPSRYEKDKRDGKLILGVRTSAEHAFTAAEESEKFTAVIGDFKNAAVDYLGKSNKNEFVCKVGDLDAIWSTRPSSVYRKILNGDRTVSAIAVSPIATDENASLQGSGAIESWNWHDYVGKPLEVRVVTGGEIVALYLDGKILGRKLAGKTNKQIATFKVDYYPGKLEAVCYHKGMECSRCALSTNTPKGAIKIKANKRSIFKGDLVLIELGLYDKQNMLIAHSDREITAEVDDGLNLWAFGNGDLSGLAYNIDVRAISCQGKALCAITGLKEGKYSIKFSAPGVRSAKTIIKVK